MTSPSNKLDELMKKLFLAEKKIPLEDFGVSRTV
jgi:hypothetical protein